MLKKDLVSQNICLGNPLPSQTDFEFWVSLWKGGHFSFLGCLVSFWGRHLGDSVFDTLLPLIKLFLLWFRFCPRAQRGQPTGRCLLDFLWKRLICFSSNGWLEGQVFSSAHTLGSATVLSGEVGWQAPSPCSPCPLLRLKSQRVLSQLTVLPLAACASSCPRGLAYWPDNAFTQLETSGSRDLILTSWSSQVPPGRF